MPLKVTIALGKNKVVELDLANKNATVQDLKEAFAKKVRNVLCMTLPSLFLSLAPLLILLRHALFLILPPNHLSDFTHFLPPSLPLFIPPADPSLVPLPAILPPPLRLLFHFPPHQA